ncbi:MAG: hypothetical protein HYV29_05115 [Ignavibacteriales bacterium]|nr:hypothetical protein [Ignavibacteriales bacterium]
MHPSQKHKSVLRTFMVKNKFSIDKFAEHTLSRSDEASKRESKTEHEKESLTDGDKAIFYIKNFLGGVYHLTADEVFKDKKNEIYIIQESKNSTTSNLPSESDIKDGLFKLILFSNLDSLILNGKSVKFKTRLKLTGKIKGEISLPASKGQIDRFIKSNRTTFNQKKIDLIKILNNEAISNKIDILVCSN